MLRTFVTLTLVLFVALFARSALAGVYTDDLAKCLVKSSTENDKVLLIQWLFAAVSLNPAVKPLASVTPSQRQTYNEGAAALLSRLLVKDCRKEAIDALKYEGTASLGTSIQVLSAIAGRELMTDPHVREGTSTFGHLMDGDQDLKTLFKAAGLAAPTK
ncbi:MAG TPA: hypothetical protein VM755_06440 [Stellaceae bacterium]|nr:hypothetical protein [Stellaceae bacterium]